MSDAPSPSLPQFDALRQANLARAKEWNPAGADTGPGFAGLELAGEVGELCNLLKKAERARLGLVGGSVSPAAIAEELADVVICADLVGLALGLDLWPIVVAKFNATSEAKGFATRLGDPIPVSVARFKDAGHPATAAGEAASATISTPVGNSTRELLLLLVDALHRDAVWHRLSDDTRVVCERVRQATRTGGGN